MHSLCWHCFRLMAKNCYLFRENLSCPPGISFPPFDMLCLLMRDSLHTLHISSCGTIGINSNVCKIIKYTIGEECLRLYYENEKNHTIYIYVYAGVALQTSTSTHTVTSPYRTYMTLDNDTVLV